MRLAVAVSGGADSIALLLHAAGTLPVADILALSVDHGTRAAAAASERVHAAGVAGRLGIAFQTIQTMPKGQGHAHWREARLDGLLGYCRDAGIRRLWLGHHADDAVETSAIRSLASGRLAGLAGIASHRTVGDVVIERPLLRYSARELRRRLMTLGFGWTEDPSNRSLAYKRSVVRRCLVATPSQRAQNLARVRRAGQWRIAHERLIAKVWPLTATPLPIGAVVLDSKALASLPATLSAKVLERAANAVAGHPTRLRHADYARALGTGPPFNLGGVVLVEHGDDWWVARNPDAIGAALPLESPLIWDRRFHLKLHKTPPPDNWTVTAVGDHRIGAMSRLGPEAALASLPAIARGETGPFWAANLTCRWAHSAEQPIFQLVR